MAQIAPKMMIRTSSLSLISSLISGKDNVVITAIISITYLNTKKKSKECIRNFIEDFR